MNNYYSFLLLIIIATLNIKAQTWTHYNSASICNQLHNNDVNDIVIDSNGKIWFATAYGVSTFDGENWKTYSKIDGMIDNSVYTLAIDKNENMWFGTHYGVSKFDGENWVSFRLKSNWIEDITVDTAGNVWVGTWGGINKFDGENWTNYTTSVIII